MTMRPHVTTTIRYDGPALADHFMDVQDLAPALLALADIIQIANRKFNGDQADIRVLVNADVEQRCFQIDLSLVQSVLEQAKGFFAQEQVATAKEIAEWIGIIGGTGGTAWGLFKFLAFLGNRPKTEGTKLTVSTENGMTTLVDGDKNTITVNHHVYMLASDPLVMERARRVVAPLQKPGYETLQFVEGATIVDTIDKAEAGLVLAADPVALDLSKDDVSTIAGHLRIKSPQYEGNARWSVLWGGKAIDVTMPPDFVQAFQHNEIDVPPNTSLKVQMEQRVSLDDSGKAAGAPRFTVLEVVSLTLPPKPTKQGDWVSELGSKTTISPTDPAASDESPSAELLKRPRRQIGPPGKPLNKFRDPD
ncbi:MAG: hypothetical protein B7Y86_12510 [Brevundimonas subvibrioides]|uniref:Uncharacterized protein n=1 Tax=Brevundimonas subvibrioides TaxID=74313 RepID=A0A258HFS2_9CAUL|nr:hypothetical protein [Brevundimonas subvibrioides]OYX55766.1 MAG: hypothetical protein B7Y86_12510 [Brevundimonas subvibrioides]